MHSLSILALSALTVVSAAPLQERQAPFEITLQAPWNSGAVTEFQIHSSCNASEQYQLRRGFEEMVQLAQHGKEHILRWGNSSSVYRKYFGNRPTVEAIGSLDIIVSGDRSNALFRCDDPDGNCAHFPTYGGHYRGTNATTETVICPLSFTERRYLSQVCAQGYNVRESSRLIFWASDLMHRLYHIPTFGQGWVDHYADGWDEITGNASLGTEAVTRDSDGLQYFSLEAWAYDIVAPGAGCPGPQGAATSAEAATATATATESVTSSSAASAEATPTESGLPENCHSHSDGSIHCT